MNTRVFVPLFAGRDLHAAAEDAAGIVRFGEAAFLGDVFNLQGKQQSLEYL